MTTYDTLDKTTFRAMFTQFSSETAYPDTMLDTFYEVAGNYISQTDSSTGGLTGSTLSYALQLLTAHLIVGVTNAAGGDITGVVTGASVADVSTTLMPPPAKSGWQYWLLSTEYGKQIWALLSMKSIGGWSVGGSAERSAFRGVGGYFNG